MVWKMTISERLIFNKKKSNYETSRRLREQAGIDSRPNPKDNDLSKALAAHVAKSRSTRGVGRRCVRRFERLRGFYVKFSDL